MRPVFQAIYKADARFPQRKGKETLYLLNDSFRVLGVRAAASEAVLERGAAFFERYRLDQNDASLLLRLLRMGGEQTLLLCSKGGPVLLTTAFFRRTGLLLAAVPRGKLAKQLRGARQYADALPEMLLVSNRLQSREATRSEEGYQLIRDWINEMRLPFLEGRSGAALPNCTSALEDALRELARLCCCELELDLYTLRRGHLHEVDLRLLVGATLSSLFLVHRSGVDRRASLSVVEGDGREPKLRLSFDMSAESADFYELKPFADRALWESELFAVTHDPEHPTRVELTFDFCGKELSVQGLKIASLFEKSCTLPFFTE